MEITQERAQEIALNVRAIVLNVNAVSEDELKECVAIIDRGEALGPLQDPSAWQRGRFGATSAIKKVLTELLSFKQAVKGMGEFK